jgi:hypothetical protein
MKKSELKEIIRESIREEFYNSLNEASVSIGNGEFVNTKDDDDKILDIAKQYSEFPHTRLSTTQKSLVFAFKDISKLLGIPTSHPMDVVAYSGGKPERTNIPKAVGSKSPLFKMLKSGKLTAPEYKDLWKKLDRKYQGLVTSYLAFLYLQGTHVNVKNSAAAKRAAMKDIGNA